MSVKDIKGKFTPMQMAQEVPWEKIKSAIVLYEDPDTGLSQLMISAGTTMKERVWLCHFLQEVNLEREGT